MPLIDATDIADAHARLAPHVTRTPTVWSPGLSEVLGAQIHCKLELLQPTGSFKVRGAFNSALSLTASERSAGLLAFSAGNHAMAVAHVGAHLGVRVTVCMPAGAVQFKIDAVRRLGADLELVEGDLVAHAMARRDELGATLVHPFDHPAIVAGTATAGVELIDDLPDVDTVLVPVGGGGLISGIATAVKLARPGVRVIGVEPETADVVSASLAAGRPLARPSRSLADGLAAPIVGQINLDHISAHVDEMVTIPESSIAPAWRDLVEAGKLAGEPAAAATIAAIQTGRVTIADDETVCLVVSGGNAAFEQLFA